MKSMTPTQEKAPVTKETENVTTNQSRLGNSVNKITLKEIFGDDEFLNYLCDGEEIALVDDIIAVIQLAAEFSANNHGKIIPVDALIRLIKANYNTA